MRNQIRAAGICQIVAAVVELAGGVLMLLSGFVQALPEPAWEGLDLSPQSAASAGISIALGCFNLAVAVARFIAGIQHLDVRGRTLGIVVAIVGGINLANCTCLPVSFLVGIYVLIVLFNSDTAAAFRERAQGSPAADVLAPPQRVGGDPIAAQSSPRQMHDRAIADELVRCLPRDWDRATLHVAVPRDRTSDRLGMEIQGPPTSSDTAEPSRELGTAVQRFIGFARMHGQEFDTLSYAVRRDDVGNWGLEVSTH